MSYQINEAAKIPPDSADALAYPGRIRTDFIHTAERIISPGQIA